MYELHEMIRYSDLDASGRLSLRGLLSMFQDCATMHSQSVGYTIEWLIENRRGWVLTSYQSHMYRMPHMGEKVVVKTAPVNARGIVGYRLFFIEDEAGRLLSEGYSEWVFLDLEKQKPIRISLDMMEVYGLEDIACDKWQSRKIDLPGKGEDVGSFKAEGFLLDTNDHMNNVYYVEACEQMIKGVPFNHLRAEFKRSAMLDDVLYMKKYPSGKSHIFSLDSESGDNFFTVEFSNRSSF